MNKRYAFTPHYEELARELMCVNLLPLVDNTENQLCVIDYETLANDVRPLPSSVYASEAVIVYCGTEAIGWSSVPAGLRKMLVKLSKATRVYYALISPAQVRSCDLPGEGKFVYNSWEHQTVKSCSTWWRYQELKPTRDILWMSRRIAPERMAIYHHLTHQTKHSVYASMGNTNYWATVASETWRNHFVPELYADPDHALRFYRRVGNHREIQTLPRAFTHRQGTWTMQDHDIMGEGGIGIAIANARCVWVSDSHALNPTEGIIHTEKLFKVFAVGRSVHPFGAQHYIRDLVELGYDFEIPEYDTIADGATRLAQYLHSEPAQQDPLHNRSVLHTRTQHNPLPPEFETTRTDPSVERPEISNWLWHMAKKTALRQQAT